MNIVAPASSTSGFVLAVAPICAPTKPRPLRNWCSTYRSPPRCHSRPGSTLIIFTRAVLLHKTRVSAQPCRPRLRVHEIASRKVHQSPGQHYQPSPSAWPSCLTAGGVQCCLFNVTPFVTFKKNQSLYPPPPPPSSSFITLLGDSGATETVLRRNDAHISDLAVPSARFTVAMLDGKPIHSIASGTLPCAPELPSTLMFFPTTTSTSPLCLSLPCATKTVSSSSLRPLSPPPAMAVFFSFYAVATSLCHYRL